MDYENETAAYESIETVMEHLYSLDSELIYLGHTESDGEILIRAQLKEYKMKCPYCNFAAIHINARYTRTFQDLPINKKRVGITMVSRKMACYNSFCSYDTFMEVYSFLPRNSRKTQRLEQEIFQSYMENGLEKASIVLKSIGIKVCRKTVYDIVCRINKEAEELEEPSNDEIKSFTECLGY